MSSSSRYSPISRVVKDLISTWVYSNIETIGVAVVVGIDNYTTNRTVTVKPLVIEEGEDGLLVSQPTISECPVILQGNENGVIHFPLEIGTKVYIGYPKHSIDEFTYGSSVDQYVPVDREVFGSSQAVVLGYAAQAGGLEVPLSDKNFEIKYHDGLISLGKSNEVLISNPNGSAELSPSGTWVISNSSVSITLNTNGTFNITGTGTGTINGVLITTGGNVITAANTNLDALKAQVDALQAAYIAHGVGAPAHPPPAP